MVTPSVQLTIPEDALRALAEGHAFAEQLLPLVKRLNAVGISPLMVYEDEFVADAHIVFRRRAGRPINPRLTAHGKASVLRAEAAKV